MRRILIFSLVYYPRNIGGAEVAIKEITDRISPQEIEFDMITLRKQAPAFERVGNVNVYRVGLPWFGQRTNSSKIFLLSKIFFVPLAFLKAIFLNHRDKYDVVWSIMASYAGFATFLFKKVKPEIPFILTIQEGDNFGRRQGIFRPFFRMIFAAADRIQAISKFLSEWSKLMGAKCPIVIVPNGVDFDHFSRLIDGETRQQMREEDHLQDFDTSVITTSRLVEKNAVDDLIRSLALLERSCKLIILGTGQEEQKLKNLTKALGVEDRVFFKGFVPHSEMPKYLQSADIFVRPSLSEGLGNSFLEAMAAGLPVIATPVGGIPDFLKDGETGLFCEVRNPKSIAQKVEKLIKDRESREHIVKQAREMVRNNYQWGMVAGKMKDVLCYSRENSHN